MKNLAFSFLFLSLAFLFPAVIHAQPHVQPAWSAKFTSPVNWQRIHSLGYIIVSTNDGLYGVNPADGKILWERKDFPALDPALFEEVEGTEFIAVARHTSEDSMLPMQAIIDVISGKVLFDSKKEGIGILSRHVLSESGRLLVIGAAKGNLVATLFMYDIASGNLLWSNDQVFKVESAGTGFLAKLQAGVKALSNLQGLIANPVEIDGESMIVAHPNYIMRINTLTGKVIWKNDIERSTTGRLLFSPYHQDIVYLATEIESETGSGFTTSASSQDEPRKYYYNLYYAYEMESGKPVWGSPAREQDMLNEVIMDERGIIVCPRSTQKPTLNLIDYKSGETLWGKKGKGLKAQGSVVSYIRTESGIVITTGFDNAFNSKGEEFYLNILDPATGTLRYEKSVKLKGDIVSTELVPGGLLFVTTREVNILDIKSGTLLWDKSIESGGPATGDKVRPFPVGTTANKLYVFSPKEAAVLEVDKNAGTYRKLTTTPVAFDGKELPKGIDVAGDGIIIYSDQNIMKVDFDGTVLYKKYYPAPRQPALVRALLVAEAVRAAYIGAAASTYAAAFEDVETNTSDATVKAVSGGLSDAYSELGQAGFAYSARALKAFSARFKASQDTPDFIMMMTRKEQKGNQLIQVGKASGDVENTIDILNDREPEYEIDQIFNYLYYRPSATDIVCYRL